MTRGTDGRGLGANATMALAVVAVIVGVAAVVVALLAQQGDPPAPGASSTTPASTTPSSTTPSSSTPSSARSSASTGTSTDHPSQTQPSSTSTAQSSPSSPPSLPASEPARLRVPQIDVASDLHPLGLADDGTLEVPSGERVDQAAWYDGSPTPGEVGPTVIEGHVTSSGGRPSVFFSLGELRSGDEVEVDREDGRTVTFEVYRVEQFAKTDFDTVGVYGPTDGPELRLLTCGGEFDEATGHHVDNTVVFASMVRSD